MSYLTNTTALLPKARAIVTEHQRGSVSLVQRHLRIGYNAASELLEMLEADDPRVQQLCRHYGRDPREFTGEAQLQAALDAGFVVREIDQLVERSTRRMVWLGVAE